MIALDTNVLSELIKSEPDSYVRQWLQRQPREEVRTTSISKAEMFTGVAVMPAGRRKELLTSLVRELFATQFDQTILPFDETAASRYAEVQATRRGLGRPIAITDAMIAAIALSNGARLATRDIADFEGIGLEVINPWEPRA